MSVSDVIKGVFERIFIFQGHNLNFIFTERKTKTRPNYKGDKDILTFYFNAAVFTMFELELETSD